MWKNFAVLVFGSSTSNGSARVMLRINLKHALLDIVAAAPTAEQLFVGGAKGQASVVIWMTHLVKMFLRRSYPQLEVEESFLCPSAECNTMIYNSEDETKDDDGDAIANSDDECFDPCLSCFHGAEFPATPEKGNRYHGDHCCEADGCWSQLGVGHKIEQMIPKATATITTTELHEGLFCKHCQKVARFALRL